MIMHQILSGPINSGKSTRLMRDVQKWMREGKGVSGWVGLKGEYLDSPVQKAGYDIVFITMSKIHERQPFIRTTPFKNSFAWKQFYFDQTILDRVATIDFGQPDIFVIDEVGPLELEDQKGFWNILSKIYSTHQETVSVVRESCVEKFKRAFPEHECSVQLSKEETPPSWLWARP